jgi:hypothetical protein
MQKHKCGTKFNFLKSSLDINLLIIKPQSRIIKICLHHFIIHVMLLI